MTNQVTKLISLISGSKKLEACLNISEINNVDDVMNIDEGTITNIETFIRKKCAQLPVEERRAFIDENMIHHPERFMIAPGLTQRLVNTCNSMTKIFKNVPLNEQNIEAISNNLKISNSLSTINIKCLENVVRNDQRYQLLNRLAIESQPSNQNSFSSTSLINYNSNSVTTDSPRQPISNPNSIDNERLSHLNPPLIESGLIHSQIVDIDLTSTPKNKSFRKLKDRSSSSIIRSLTREFLPNSSFTESSTHNRARFSNLIKHERLDNNELVISSTPRHIVNIKFEPDLESSNVNYLECNSSPGYTESNMSSSRRLERRMDFMPPRKSRINEIDFYYNKVIEDGEKLFYNCSLIPKIDFDIELNVPTRTERKLCAHFVCYRCHTAVRKMKKLKFYLTERGAVINSNIINHLKIHFEYRYSS